MALGKRLINTGGVAACTTDSVDPFGDSNGVALYSLDYDASDASGSYDGTPSNVTFGVGGKINYGARFNGSSSYIDVSSFSFGSDNLSISMWIKPSSTQNAYANIIDFNQTNTSKVGVFAIQQDASNTNQYKIWQWNGSSYNQSNSVTLTADTWNHLVYALQSNGNYAFYLNGTSSTSGSNLTASTSGVTETLNIGRWYNNGGSAGRYFNGDIDQVRIFSKALNQTEVDTLYNNGDGETACVYTATTTDNDYPTTNLAYYKLDNSAEDEKGSYDGTETNIEYRFGRYGQAAVFNGSSSKITAPSILSSSYTGSVSYSAWFKTSNTANTIKTIIVTDDTTGSISGKVLLLAVSYSGGTSGLLELTGYNFPTFSSFGTTNVADGNWHNVIVVLDNPNATLKVYLDGNSSPEITKTLSSSNITLDKVFSEDWTIGSQGAIRFFDGDIDQVRIYSTALTSSQVTELYNEKPETDTSNFKTVLYEGTGSTQYISNVGFQPDLVWTKSRDSSYDHNLVDSVRGINPNGTLYALSPNQTIAQTDSVNNVKSLDANGFTVQNAGSRTNANNESYVSWCWKGSNADAVSNTVGDLSSQVSANDKGFSIVKHANSGSTSDTVGHGLTVDGVATTPELYITKKYDTTTSWNIYTTVIDGSMDRLLFTTAAKSDVSLNAPTSTVFYNQSGTSDSKNYISYCFASVSGYSKIGSYSGSTTTVTLNIGFKPSFVMIKSTNLIKDWIIFDTVRSSGDQMNDYLVPNTDAGEVVNSSIEINATSTGFTVASGLWTGINTNGGEYIYMAFK